MIPFLPKTTVQRDYGLDAPVGRGSTALGLQPQLWSAIVAAYDAMRAEGLEPPDIVSAYRPTEVQAKLYRENPAGRKPPGQSLHESGLAIDVDPTNRAALDWLDANAHRFGLMRMDDERNHWQLVPQMWRAR